MLKRQKIDVLYSSIPHYVSHYHYWLLKMSQLVGTQREISGRRWIYRNQNQIDLPSNGPRATNITCVLETTSLSNPKMTGLSELSM